MSKPYDATLNSLIDAHPADWANFLALRSGVPAGPADVVDTDLSSTLQADRLFRIRGPRPAIVHLELESSSRLGIPEELLRYNVVARRSCSLPVHSVVMLLRPKASASDLSGFLELPDGNGATYITFRYAVVRLWEESFEDLLNAGLGIAPLSLLTDEAAADLPVAAERFRERLHEAGLPNNVVREIAGYTRVLCGLRYTFENLKEASMGGRNILEDSIVYQDLMARGAAIGEAIGEARGEARGGIKQAQKTILHLGSKRFGVPTSDVAGELRSIDDPERLNRLTDRVLDATGWTDLLATH